LQAGSIRRRQYRYMFDKHRKVTVGNGEWSGIPARLDITQVAAILGFQEHDIPVLVAGRHLEPLGKPMPNARKYFARVGIMELAENPAWLSKATKAVYQYWQGKNASRAKEVAAEAIGGVQ